MDTSLERPFTEGFLHHRSRPDQKNVVSLSLSTGLISPFIDCGARKICEMVDYFSWFGPAIPPHPQRLQLLPQADLPLTRAAPVRPHPVTPQKAVLVLEQPRQRHEQNPLLRPAGFGGDGEHLGG
jgi:hypothetical protein